MQVAALLFAVSAVASGLAFSAWDLTALALRGRRRRRCRLGHRARLHRRGRAGPPARPARLAAAARHRAGDLRGAAVRRRPVRGRRRRRPGAGAADGLALDAARGAAAGDRLRPAVDPHPGVAALPGGERRPQGRGDGAAQGARPGRRREADRGHRPHRPPGPPRPACATCAARSPGCCRSSGSASRCRSSSRPSASTSSSTTRPRCGARSASPSRRRSRRRSSRR